MWYSFFFFFWGACAKIPPFVVWRPKHTYKVSCRSRLATIAIGFRKVRWFFNVCSCALLKTKIRFNFAICVFFLRIWCCVYVIKCVFWMFLKHAMSHLYTCNPNWPLFLTPCLKRASATAGFCSSSSAWKNHLRTWVANGWVFGGWWINPLSSQGVMTWRYA